MRAVKKNPKTNVSDIANNFQRAGVKVSQSTIRGRLGSKSTHQRMQTTSLAITIGRPDWSLAKSKEVRLISLGTKFYRLMKQ